MGIDSIFLSLMPLIIAVVIGMMIHWLIGFGGIFLGGAITLFIMGVLNQSRILSFSAIPFLILFLVCAFESVRRIISESDFKKRIAQHITDGTVLYRDKMAYKTGDEYERVANDWVGKVASDIRKHRGQSEAGQFLAEYPKKQNVSMESEDTQRDRIQNMLSSLTGWLAWLQQRL